MTVAEIHDLIESVGIAAGGLWAAWTFHKLQKVRTAEIKNRAALQDMRRKRLQEQELKSRMVARQPVLQMGLRILEDVDGHGGSSLRITVALSNRGDQNLMIQFNEAFITVGQVAEGKDGKVRMTAVHRLPPWFFNVQ